MELVEGPTLADKLTHGAIPLEESLRIARLIAAALEAAHEKGIIHGDLKPANIKIKPDGAVKVLDFGLSKQGSLSVPGGSAGRFLQLNTAFDWLGNESPNSLRR